MSSIISIQSSEESFSPPTLQEICRFYCTSNAKTLLFASQKRNQNDADVENSKLRKSIQLPVPIWEGLLEDYHGAPEDYLPLILAVIKCRKNFHIKSIHLPNTPTLTDERLRLVMACFPASLDIHNCPSLTKKAVAVINEYGQHLEFLQIGSSTQILTIDVEAWILKLKETPQGIRKVVRSIADFFNGRSVTHEDDGETHGLLRTPKLKKLVVWGLHVNQLQHLHLKNVTSSHENAGGGDAETNVVKVDYWEYLTRDFIHELQHLDLSSCQELNDLSFLLEAKDNLKALHLHDVLFDYDEKTWGILKQLTELRFLDVSQYNELASIFPNPDEILDKIVTALPHLVGLDISGTNLPGFEPEGFMPCGIMGLESRKETPLKFLGLLTSHYNASCRSNIPATKIAGGKDMEQLLIALQFYTQRENSIKKVIRMLYEKMQEMGADDFLPSHTILRLLVQAMKNHVYDKHTQIVALAAMFIVIRRIYKGPTKCLHNVDINQVLYWISKAMNVHSRDVSLLKNGMLNLLFLVPYIDMAPYTEDIAPILLEVATVATAGQDVFMTKAVAFTLHNMTRYLRKSEKEKLGESDIIEKLCLIVDNLIVHVAMDQMTVFWTLLWNITDDVPSNCKQFVKAKGIDVCFRFVGACLNFLNCGVNLANLQDAQIPMFALLSNLLQHPSFEAQIITLEQIANVFDLLMKVDSAGNEKLCFHICGFLCKVASKKISYSLESPTRQKILHKVFRIMSKLDFKKQFDYDFRHLTPLSTLLEVKDAPEIHAWVLWTLVNLTETNPKRYCNLIATDKLIKIKSLSERFQLPEDHRCSTVINRLCRTLTNNVESIMNPEQLSGYQKLAQIVREKFR
ncbi:Protein zer-1 [Orchesella cincta]|uniref:Protein zer-1 n=1 Tax=Orchesella cincta TaxID=48709 RepID=A0A1D2NGD2_ORCCI|nr:Protein zer-1 [Orchesella cincta]